MRYSPDIETFDPKLEEYLARIVEFWEKVVRDSRRFRPNMLLEGADEDSLIGSTIAIGDAIVEIRQPIQRCVMVTRPQPHGIDHDLSVLRTIVRDRGARLA